MDGQGGGDVGVRLRVIDAVEQVRDECPVPVVDMDHVRKEIEGRHHLEHGPAEVDGAGVVIPEAEHPVTVIELRAIDEVDHQLVQAAFVDRGGHDLGAQRNLDIGGDRAQAVSRDVDLAVAGQDHAHVVADPPQLFRQ